eukprot:tig00021795_g23521.t1
MNHQIVELPMSGRADVSPWPGPYWPTFLDSINDRVHGPESLSAVEKARRAARDVSRPHVTAAQYARAFGLDEERLAERVSQLWGWNALRSIRTSCAFNTTALPKGAMDPCTENGTRNATCADGVCIDNWEGICHGWAAASILIPEPSRRVVMNGVDFTPFDLKGLATVFFADIAYPNLSFLSTRCDTAKKDIPGGRRLGRATTRTRGPSSSPSPTPSACAPRPAHLPPTPHLPPLPRRRRKALVMDTVFDLEVWNFPVFRYNVTRHTLLSRRAAVQLVNAPRTTTVDTFQGDAGADAGAYTFHRIALDLYYVYEVPLLPQWDRPLSDYVRFVQNFVAVMRLEMVLQVDAASGEIIGGEWLGDSKENHPDFIWAPLFPAGLNAFPANRTVASYAPGRGIRWGDVASLLAAARAPGPALRHPVVVIIGPTPTPAAEAGATPYAVTETPSPTPSPTWTEAWATPTPTETPSPSPTPSPTWGDTWATPTPTETPSPSPTWTETPWPTWTASPSPSPTPTPPSPPSPTTATPTAPAAAAAPRARAAAPAASASSPIAATAPRPRPGPGPGPGAPS